MDFVRFGSNGAYYYLPAGVEPADAVTAFLFKDTATDLETVSLDESWNPGGSGEAAGYYAFFPPDGARDWSSFTAAVRAAFEALQGRVFGWFQSAGVSNGFVSVTGSGAAKTLGSASPIDLRNIQLTLSATPTAKVTLPTEADTFVISGASPQLVYQGAQAGQETSVTPEGDVSIPMTGDQQGTVSAQLAMSMSDLAGFEAGQTYFGDAAGPGQLLEAIRYPGFMSASGTSGDVGLKVYLDPNQPTATDRSFFEFTDSLVGSGFATPNGSQVMLAPSGAGTPTSARFVLSNRPRQSVSDEGAFYLTPMGPFEIHGESSGGAVAGGNAERVMCGFTATETFSFAAGDLINFVPGQPSFKPATPVQTGDDAYEYLTSSTTTSYVSFSSKTAQNTYFSQPQQSPLYKSAETLDPGASGGGGAGSGKPIKAYSLDYNELAAWPPVDDSGGASGPVANTPVPLVPYGAVDPTVLGFDLDTIREMEAKVLNPARRQILDPNATTAARAGAGGAPGTTFNMTPLGLLGGFDGANWDSTQLAMDPQNNILQITGMQDKIRSVLSQNQVFAVMSRDAGQFQFKDPDQGEPSDLVDISGWAFALDPDGTADPDGVPPVLILKFYKDKSIKDLVEDASLWSAPDTFNANPSGADPSNSAPNIQAYLREVISTAEAAVEADQTSVYANFVATVNSTSFTGMLAVNSNLRLDDLPDAIKALLGGMVKEDGSSNIAAFRAHHVGVQISDTDSSLETPTLTQSAYFALVDYEAPVQDSEAGGAPGAPCGDTRLTTSAGGVDPSDFYSFKVEYLRALFSNSELTDFSAKILLTVNNLFDVGVNLFSDLAGGAEGDDSNVITITGSYEDQGGTEAYSFIAEKTFEFTFDGAQSEDGDTAGEKASKDSGETNAYLQKITFTKVQFSATSSAEGDAGGDAGSGTTETINSRFSIWGSMEFQNLDFLDVLSFDKLVFADLGISMTYDLTTFTDGTEPDTSTPSLAFSPGNLRFDVSQSSTRDEPDSLLDLLPFKLTSFMYSEQGQQVADLNYFPIAIGVDGFSTEISTSYKYALAFDFDLGSMGGLVGSSAAFKFGILIGWQPPEDGGGLVLGVQMPEADGKLEITIEGVLTISIEHFILKYVERENTEDDDTPDLFVLGLEKAYIEILNTRMPPKGTISLGIFAPTEGADKVGWIAAYQKGEESSKAAGGAFGPASESPIGAIEQLEGPSRRGGLSKEGSAGIGHPMVLEAQASGGAADDDEGSSTFDLTYLGIGQRVGPSPDSPPTNFDAFLEYMEDEFFQAFKDGKYDEIYHPDSDWLFVTKFSILGVVDFGMVFYDVTPFYSLQVGIKDIITFEITYTKVSDDVGLYYIDLTLPDTLRTFQCGAASVTLPSLDLSIYTNGDFKVDVGFPANDDWSKSFRVEAMAGPVPVTGSGGFYFAKLSSATTDVFTNDYDAILAFGLGARLGVGKSFVAGPLKAGVSLTFFGIIEGAAGYESGPDANVIGWLVSPGALALSGQFGVIGELYGTVDFVIIKASVNVTIQASIGVQLTYETTQAGGSSGSTSILLYVQASVNASASVSINMGFFKIKMSFSFSMELRFEWLLVDSNSAGGGELLLGGGAAPSYDPAFPLQAGLSGGLAAWMTREFTTLYSDGSDTGTPWTAISLAMEWLEDFSSATVADFKSFENLAAQMVSWALAANLPGVSSWSDTVSQDQLNVLNSDPDTLVNGLTYQVLLQELAQAVTLALTTVDTTTSGQTAVSATLFPMLPFLTLKSSGREDGDWDFVFSDKSQVSTAWVDTTLQAYFEQLYTNITSEGSDAAGGAAEETVALTETLFLDWFQALIRISVNGMLQQMQNDDTQSGKIEDVFLAAVKGGQMQTAAGQLAQFFRSGLRLPKTSGMETPDGVLSDTNAAYSLIWQQLPVGAWPSGEGAATSYSITLDGDATQTWVTAGSTVTIEKSESEDYASAKLSDLSLPSGDTPIEILQTGPRAYALQTATEWTEQPVDASAGDPVIRSVRTFATPLATYLATQAAGLDVSFMERSTSGAYADPGTSLQAADVMLALQVNLIVRKVPGTTAGTFVPNTYSLTGATLSQQDLIRELLGLTGPGNDGPVKGIQLLYQTSQDSSGLASDAAAQDLFVLRTNTTTQSIPPQSLLGGAASEQQSVGADASDVYGFLQILEQASVTNQSGYLLYYADSTGAGLPEDLFGNQTFAPVTVLIELGALGSSGDADGTIPTYANTAVLTGTQTGELYYVQTTDPADEVSYVSLAAGSTGFTLTRPDPGENDDSAVSTLNALYGLVSYQVDQTSGFEASNLSVPVGPTTDDGATQDFRMSVPLYKLAPGNSSLNRYASINEPYKVEAFVNDAFGNQIPGNASTPSGTNLYFDDIQALSNWTAMRTSFDFRAWSTTVPTGSPCDPEEQSGSAEAQKLTVYLCPNLDALPADGSDGSANALDQYQQIADQLGGIGVSMYVSTNLDARGSEIVLDSTQFAAVRALVAEVIAYLGGGPDPQPVALTVDTGSGVLPTVFQIQVEIGIRRDTTYVDPTVAAEHADSVDVRTSVSARQTSGDLSGTAANFGVAFPAFTLATGPADGQAVVVGAPPTGGADDDASGSAPKALWAVNAGVTQFTIDNSTVVYSGPTPLSTDLFSDTDLAMPTLPSGYSLPVQMSFSDIDVDDYNRTFFAAVDGFLAAASATAAWQIDPSSYETVANSRKSLADLYSANEVQWLFTSPAKFIGTDAELAEGREDFGQQLRGALGAAYKIDTIVQMDVTFTAELPDNVGKRLQIFGQVQDTSGQSGTTGDSFGLSTARVDVPGGSGSRRGTFTFLYGLTDVKLEEEASVTLDLQWAATHLQVFLDDDDSNDDAARPSVWLQFVDAFETPPARSRWPSVSTPRHLRWSPSLPGVADPKTTRPAVAIRWWTTQPGTTC